MMPAESKLKAWASFHHLGDFPFSVLLHALFLFYKNTLNKNIKAKDFEKNIIFAENL